MIPMVEGTVASVARKCAELEIFKHWRLRDDGPEYVNPILEAMEEAKREQEAPKRK
jgi:hypothetical protein